MTRRALVFGARGQIGRFLLPRLREAGWSTLAITRHPLPVEQAGLRWQRFDLFADTDLAIEGEVDVVFSLGPLDAFAAWWERSEIRAPRVVAFGSTSASVKQASPDAVERALAARLASAEARLLQACARRGAALTLLRPTLVYGAGTDRNLTRIAQLARRWRLFALPRGADGLRQPVHADDLAQAAWNAAQRASTPQSCYDLPGGETLSYREMAGRVLACLEPQPRLIEVPMGPLRLALAGARRLGLLSDAGQGVIARLKQDLVFDIAPARRDLDYTPRPFQPRPEMFVTNETA